LFILNNHPLGFFSRNDLVTNYIRKRHMIRLVIRSKKLVSRVSGYK